jgi:hydroxylamine reductase (hybrid-cluster protein)
MVYHETPAQVEEHASSAHVGQLPVPEQLAVGRPAVHVQGHNVDRLEELLEGAAQMGVAKGKLVGGVVEPHAHPQHLCHH